MVKHIFEFGQQVLQVFVFRFPSAMQSYSTETFRQMFYHVETVGTDKGFWEIDRRNVPERLVHVYGEIFYVIQFASPCRIIKGTLFNAAEILHQVSFPPVWEHIDQVPGTEIHEQAAVCGIIIRFGKVMLVHGQNIRQGFSGDGDMGIKEAHGFGDGKVVTFGHRGIGGFGVFQVFQYIRFCFQGEVLARINERVRLVEGALATITPVAALLEKEGTVSVSESGMRQFPEEIAMDLHVTTTERADGWLGLQFHFYVQVFPCLFQRGHFLQFVFLHVQQFRNNLSYIHRFVLLLIMDVSIVRQGGLPGTRKGHGGFVDNRRPAMDKAWTARLSTPYPQPGKKPVTHKLHRDYDEKSFFKKRPGTVNLFLTADLMTTVLL